MFRSELWPEPTAHREYWERHHNYIIYEYDPADDGPETEIIPRIIKAYPLLKSGNRGRVERASKPRKESIKIEAVGDIKEMVENHMRNNCGRTDVRWVVVSMSLDAPVIASYMEAEWRAE